MAVAFDEDNSSPRGSLRDGKHIVTRTGLTAWGDLDLFAIELMPPSTGKYTPAVGAAMPGNNQLRVSAFSFEPHGNAAVTGQTFSALNSYTKAKWSITYERPEYAVDETEAAADGDPIPFLSHTWEGGGEFLTLPDDALLWVTSGGDPSSATFTSSVGDEANAGLFIPSIEHQVTWSRVPSPPFDDIRARVGKVNHANMILSTGTAAPETLLFLNPSISREVMSDGARAWSVSYKFSERRVIAEDQTDPGGWNHFYRNNSGASGFYRMKRTTVANPLTRADIKDVYDKISFAELFPTG